MSEMEITKKNAHNGCCRPDQGLKASNEKDAHTGEIEIGPNVQTS